MTQNPTRPRILCVRPTANIHMSSMMTDLVGEWVAALQHHAEIEIARGEFDLASVCDTFRPDLIIYESIDICRLWIGPIHNADSHPDIPRVLLLNCDPHNPLRPVSYGLCRELRIEAAFQFGDEHTQFMPEVQFLDCFSLSLFIDPDVFAASNEPKIYPVTVFSANLMPDFYAWRTKLKTDLSAFFPTFLYPHPGYGAGQGGPYAIRGRDYARIIAMSRFAAADTTRLDYVVRKHLEIPAAGAVLLAPESVALANYGFRDGENCLMGSGVELARKIFSLEEDPARYAAVRAGGIHLVHGRYTRQTWTGILDWLVCRQRRTPGQVIRQDGPLGPFHLAEAGTPSPPAAPRRDSDITAILRKARETILFGGDEQEAAAELQKVQVWCSHMSEPWLLLGVLALMHNQVPNGIFCIARRADEYKENPFHQRLDPVEAALLWLAANAAGLHDLAEAMRQWAEIADHLMLRRVRWLLSPDGGDAADLESRRPGDVLSIHWLGQEPLVAWCGVVARIWAACGRPLPHHVAERLHGGSDAIAA